MTAINGKVYGSEVEEIALRAISGLFIRRIVSLDDDFLEKVEDFSRRSGLETAETVSLLKAVVCREIDRKVGAEDISSPIAVDVSSGPGLEAFAEEK